jgi:hypothetical protein
MPAGSKRSRSEDGAAGEQGRNAQARDDKIACEAAATLRRDSSSLHSSSEVTGSATTRLQAADQEDQQALLRQLREVKQQLQEHEHRAAKRSQQLRSSRQQLEVQQLQAHQIHVKLLQERLEEASDQIANLCVDLADRDALLQQQGWAQGQLAQLQQQLGARQEAPPGRSLSAAGCKQLILHPLHIPA